MRSFLVEIGQSLKGIGLTEKQAEQVIREAIHNADQCSVNEAKKSGWTAEDTLACCVGSCAEKVGFEGQALLKLKDFGERFDAMFTERYERRAGELVANARNIRMGVLGAFRD